uniref:Carboxylic ester hydrolase n=1 Tax=Panagrellus redivivus TaxID=6233 RepID=A0A7E4W5W0_PANRE
MESRWLLFGTLLFVGFIGVKRVFFESSNVTKPVRTDRIATVIGLTKTGPIEGFVHTTNGGVKANVFLGIPYAAPPVGQLRFERPQPPNPWTKPLETKSFRKACVPFISQKLHGGIETVSEDCLYLNVMTPTNLTKKDKRAVLVYIHGGGFNFGDCIRAGFDKYVTNFVSRGVIVVTMSYRVGLYGFFSTGDSVAEGNNGLWDQVAALKWIHDNIALFRGDPNSVTVFGQSAGSTSADILALAPPSRGLFCEFFGFWKIIVTEYVHKVVQASGSAAHHWSINNNDPVASTMKVLHALGFHSNNSAEIKAFLKTQTVARILEVSSTSGTARLLSAEC